MTASRIASRCEVVENAGPPAEAAGWVQLFNGKDLTGWKTHPDQPGNWQVKDGVLVGSEVPSYLFSDGGKFENFHLRVEARINRGGDSGIFFRVPFAMRPGRTADQLRPAAGYEAEIQANPANLMKTGSVWDAETVGSPPKALWKTAHGSLTKANEWFTLELIAQGSHFITIVNGIQTADCSDPLNKYAAGHFALQVYSPQTTVEFRKIEIKELPPVTLPLPPTFKNSIGMEFVMVPKGKSWLGGGKDKLGDKEVEIPADFYLGKYEVTQEEWQKVMGENPSHFSRNGAGKDAVKDISDADLKRFPVESVSWDRCQVFVAKLNKQEKETGWVYRLADGGGMGVCLSGRPDGGQGGQRLRLLLRQADEYTAFGTGELRLRQRVEADVQGGLVRAERSGALRHARQRVGVVRRRCEGGQWR